MEKLKAALDKARAERATVSGGAPRAARLGPGAVPANPGVSQVKAAAPPADASSTGASEDPDLHHRVAATAPAAPVDADTVDAAWAALSRMEVDARKLRRRRLVALTGGNEAAAFDLLRTKVLQMCATHGWTRIGVTSPLAGSGKTTTSLNLCVSLARQVDLRVILMDMDMRRPAVAKSLAHTGEGTVADVLKGKLDFADHAVSIGDNLAIAMNHRHHRDPSDLFLRLKTGAVLDEIENSYQPNLMLFDLPPALVNDDAQAFLDKLDAVIIVAEAGSSTISQIDVCEKELAEQTNVLGIVLNKCRYHTDGYGHYDYDYS